MSRRLLHAYFRAHEKQELKPCPFCGNEAARTFVLQKKKVRNSTYYKYVYVCNCGAQGPYGQTKEEAFNNWNKRSR